MRVRVFIVTLFLTIFTLGIAYSQAIDPLKSAKAAAATDNELITESINDNHDAMFLSQKALDRATDSKVKELAQLILTDHTAMLYSMEQLQTAGAGSSVPKSEDEETNTPTTVALLNRSLSSVSGSDFDSVWVAGVLNMQQIKYDQFTAAKETVRNPQLKMAITEALPMLRKHVTQLKSTQKYLTKLATQRRKEEAAAQKAKK